MAAVICLSKDPGFREMIRAMIGESRFHLVEMEGWTDGFSLTGLGHPFIIWRIDGPIEDVYLPPQFDHISSLSSLFISASDRIPTDHRLLGHAAAFQEGPLDERVLFVALAQWEKRLLPAGQYLRNGNNGDRIPNLHELEDEFPFGFTVLDSDLTLLYANQAHQQLLGYRWSSEKPIHCYDVYGREGVCPECPAQIARDSGHATKAIRHLDDDRVIETQVFPVRNQEGQIVRLLNFTRDITPEYRHRHWLEALLESISEGLMVVSRDRRITWRNDRMAEWFPRTIESAFESCEAIFRNIPEESGTCPVQRAFEGQSNAHALICVAKEDGGKLYYDVTSTPIPSIRGEIKEVMVLVRDVTERETIIKSLTHTRMQLEKVNFEINEKVNYLSLLNEIVELLETTSDLNDILNVILIAVTAEQGMGFNRAFLLLADPEAHTLNGSLAIGPSNESEASVIWSDPYLRRATLRELLSSYRMAIMKRDVRVNEVVRRFKLPLEDQSNIFSIAAQKRVSFNILKASENPLVPASVLKFLGVDAFAVVPLVSAKGVEGVLIVDNMINKRPIQDRDVEMLKLFSSHAALAIERAALTKELQKRLDELHELNQQIKLNQNQLIRIERLSAIGEMAAEVAHEIRNPMVSIGGFAKNLLRKMEHDDPNYQFLTIILEEVKRLEEIVSKILGYASPMMPSLTPTELNELVKQSMIMVEDELSSHAIQMEQSYDPTMPLVPLDPQQIHQVLLNLLRNAVFEMPQGGRLTIETQYDQEFAEIRISDTGRGIPDEVRKEIFKPFYSTKSTGSGLGLAIASQIIANHNGIITVDSQPGQGATFIIKIPLAEKE